MIVTIHKIKRLTYKRVTFYSVHREDRGLELDDFAKRMYDIERYRIQLGQIFQFIKEIGENYGAREELFKHERAAEAIAPGHSFLTDKNSKPRYHYIENENGEFGLRLYCIRLNENAVILLNGDMKTHDYPDQCENCRGHFAFANRLSRKIDEAIREKNLFVNNSEIEYQDDFVIEI